MKIYKYQLRIRDEQRIRMPHGAKILSAGVTHHLYIFIWAMVDLECSVEERVIRIFGTGESLDHVANLKFIGTVVLQGSEVWHVFEEVA